MFWLKEETIIFKIQSIHFFIREIDNFWVAWCLCLKARLQKCYAIDTKMILYSHANNSHFHKEGFALSLVWKEGFWNSVVAYLCLFINMPSY